MSKVSIIVPIYNVEKYIERCAVSLFEQDFDDIEYIFVNDCTPDNSVDILQKVIEKYPNRKPNAKIIHHKENKGLGSARKTGLENAVGEYVLHIDSDDWCELDMISSLYAKAKETDADIVACDYFLNYTNREVYQKQDYTGNTEKDIWNLWIGVLRPYVWNKLVKRDLYVKNNICPPIEISMIEDYWLMARLFSVTKNIAYVPKAFMHYWQGNSNALTKIFNEKSFEDFRWLIKTTTQFLKEKNLYEKYKEAFNIKKLAYILWFNNGQYDRKLINSICPEAHKLKYLQRTNAWKYKFSWRNKILFVFYFLHLDFLIQPARIINKSIMKIVSMLRKVKVLIEQSISFFILGLSFLFPRNKNIWVFGNVSGAFNDNVKYLFIHIAESHPELRAIWIANDKSVIEYIKSKGFEAYYKYSVKGIYYSLRGKFYFFFTYPSNINLWTSGGAVRVNLWHGVPIKKIEFDLKNRPACNLSLKSRFLLPERYMRYHYVLSTSQKVSELFSSAFRVNTLRCLEYGYPRNEILLYSEEKLMAFVNKYEPIQTKKLIQDIQQYKKVFVYMPTWRDDGRDFIQVAGLDFNVLNTIMKNNNFCLILKLHHMTKLPIGFESNKNIVLLHHKSDIYPILPFTDCLITDYSSIYFDYKLMQKEVILFPFDQEEYLQKDREMYYSYDLVTENQPVAHDFKELLVLIQSDNINISDNHLLQDMIFETKGVESSKKIVEFLQNQY